MEKMEQKKINEKVELRSFNFEVRAQQDEERGSYLEGTPIVYEQWTDLGWYDERIADGALTDTDLKDVRFLVNHNTDMIPLARSRNNNENSTMQMVVGEEGMDIRADLDTENNADARALYSATKRGDISGMSFMMTVDGEEWNWENEEHPTRTITRIGKVFEVSAVSFPAYEATSLEARDNEEALESAKSALESAKAEAEKSEAINELKSLLDELEA